MLKFPELLWLLVMKQSTLGATATICLCNNAPIITNSDVSFFFVTTTTTTKNR